MARAVTETIKRSARFCLATAAAAMFAGCAQVGVSSLETISFQTAAFGGEPEPVSAEAAPVRVKSWNYALPKGVFKVSLYEAGAAVEGAEIAFMLRLEGPFFVADDATTHRLTLSETEDGPEPAVELGAAAPVLRSISFGAAPAPSSSGSAREGTAIQEARQTTASPGRRLAGPLTIDILSQGERDQAARKFEAVIVAYLENIVSAKECTEFFYSRPNKCVEATFLLREIRPESGEEQGYIVLSASPIGAGAKNAGAGSVAPDCSVGLCYRAPRRYRVSVRMGPQLQGGPLSDPWGEELIVSLPNDNPVTVAPLDQESLRKQGARILFDRAGAPVAVSLTKGPDIASSAPQLSTDVVVIDAIYPRLGTQGISGRLSE